MKHLTSDELRALCIKEKWFEGGNLRQYNKLFERNAAGASMGELATIIWLCSDSPKDEIYEKLCHARLNKTLI